MKKIIPFLLSLISILFVFNSCEKVIDIEINDAEQRIVIEAFGSNFEGDNAVLLSKTGNVYAQSNFEKISGANVKITDKNGVEFIFSETIPGTYKNDLFIAEENNTYNLFVDIEGEIFTATSTTQTVPKVDSLYYIEQIGGSFGGGSVDTTYLVFYSFTDKEEEVNYYRFVIYVNNVKDNFLYLGDDKIVNGSNVQAPFFATTVKKGDLFFAELRSFDKAIYTYFYTLQSNAGGDPFSPTPANPVSNINGECEGYFSIFLKDTISIVIPN